MKKSARILVCFLLLAVLLCGCSSEKTFTSGELTITLPAHYLDLSSESVAAGKEFLYGFKDVGIMGIKEEKTLVEEYYGELTLAEYADLLNIIGGYGQEVSEKDGIVTYTYTAESDGDNFTYVTAFFESDAYYWTVQVYTPTAEYGAIAEDLWGYMRSVTIAQ